MCSSLPMTTPDVNQWVADDTRERPTLSNVTCLVFDTNVCGVLAACPDRAGIIHRLKSHYRIAASANTLFELLLGLCKSNSEGHFKSDQDRFRVAMGCNNYQGARFLDHGLVFALSRTLGLDSEDTGVGRKLFRDYTKLA
jgi:hypothetical protein